MNKVNQKYSYISHPDNLPLELTGSSKKRIKSLNKEQFLESRCNMNNESRNVILNKLNKGSKDVQLVKSILPGNQRRTEQRRSSVRTFDNKENIKASGIQYLLEKAQKVKPVICQERAHVHSNIIEPKKTQEKKHYVQQSLKTYQSEAKRPVHNKESVQAKLNKDIYSNVYRLEKENPCNKKYDSYNLFKTGQDLGFEPQRTKKFSDMKMIEMVGSQHVKEIKKEPRERRQDWRTSNVNFY